MPKSTHQESRTAAQRPEANMSSVCGNSKTPVGPEPRARGEPGEPGGGIRGPWWTFLFHFVKISHDLLFLNFEAVWIPASSDQRFRIFFFASHLFYVK